MIKQPTHLGIYIGLGLGLIYLLIHGFKKEKPDFTKFATIILSCVGAVAAIDFGLVAITETASNLGKLQDQRLPMFLGAGAVAWLAVEQIIKIYYKLLKA